MSEQLKIQAKPESIGAMLAPLSHRVLQRCSNGVECEECRKKREAGLQRAAVSAAPTSGVPPIVHEVLRSPGKPLDAGTQAFMGSRFGHDFSGVRVHTDERAAESARAVNALAYTVGRDVVFGAGQYMPGTAGGKRLLAHELTHTIQQSSAQPANTMSLKDLRVNDPHDMYEQDAHRVSNSILADATPKTSPSSMPVTQLLQRQSVPATTTKPTTATAPATTTAPTTSPASAASSATWQNCASNEVGSLNKELAAAVTWVNKAISDLQNTKRPAKTTNVLGRYLSTNASDITGTILPKLQLILAELNSGPSNFRCQTEAQCKSLFPNGANAYSGHPITLCPGYFGHNALDRSTTLIHEAGHNAGLAGNVVEWQWPFPGLSVDKRLGNTESYAAFIRSNFFEVAPFQSQVGIQLGTGVAFGSNPSSARFLVTTEQDVVLKQRIFHFIDLHQGTRIDVDSSGTLLASLSLGTRLFTPSALSRVPFFLDVKTGVVGGVHGAATTGQAIAGPSLEGRVGVFGGNFSGSIGYRQVWNLLKNNDDIHEITINGEVRF